MDREAKLPVPGAAPPRSLIRPILNAETTSSSSSSYSSSSPPDFLRHVQAAFKRHRPLGVTQSNTLKPRRTLVPRREISRSSVSDMELKKSQVGISSSQGQGLKDSIEQIKNPVAAVMETQEDASITPPSICGTITNFNNSYKTSDLQRHHSEFVSDDRENNPMPSSHVESQLNDIKRKVRFSMADNAPSHEMEWDTSNQVEAPNGIGDESKHRNFQNREADINFRSDGAVPMLPKRATVSQDQLHQLRNFLSQPATQSSVVGSSCATTTSVHSASAAMLNPTTYSHSHLEGGARVAVEPVEEFDVNFKQKSQRNMVQVSYTALKNTSGMQIDQAATSTSTSASMPIINDPIKDHQTREKYESLAKETCIPKHPSYACDSTNKERGSAKDVTGLQSQDPLSKNPTSDVKLESSKPEKQEKIASDKNATVPRKKNYDPDMFFKVNGKLYQRLGKIGSGGSSEVHKVISSDCKIYALKKIKLKGRDYATAYGFCQEILYLNKLKGKNNIIQLIDYEVTDKSLLREVMNGSASGNKDGRVKDDGYIYMVLEYGEIDLAHMLSQKWKEMDSNTHTIDENWLRFYWQQILLAVNTIHEERIVHSDLKPANFLLVRGSLKLIDFGIAKAIMSDTTNIQRDSQVGTLSYMSPEAFLCNESDANGNTIKCGRSSDIWSLGCILYQMVYGRTPFSEYKTFWAKFKVITDQNHEITYEPVPNPWLLDLMKKCLAWDRNERWRIPQLLQHPFLVPPVPTTTQPSLPEQQQDCKLLQLVAEACASNQEASNACCELRQLLGDPVIPLTHQSLTVGDQQRWLLSQLSKVSFKLWECLSKMERE
ncbi:serine/threonine-protein kinase MPS1 isoform X2 [Euphorbia lathyris]|uniref:serine/threonine-protein kinase MPS1 isoform X2 n=1 Tax=Euphorbia lathyris TaxID=212925 RepID=UPI0033139666